ncbi:Inosine-5'-monophosphate dehydrogenase [uncultured archaeon]|nr:Inosine-5'-monophosphate dehydrogenase [uncultured archaeon]
MHIYLESAILVILIIISAFFAASEVAFLSMSNVRFHTLQERGAAGVESLGRLRHNRRRVIIALLIGSNIANVAASVLATDITTNIFGPETGLGIAVGLMSFLLLTFGDIAPKSAASTYGERMALGFAPIIEIFYWAAIPLVVFFEFVNRMIPGVYARPTGIERFSEDDLRSAVSLGAQHQSITLEEKQLIENVLEFDKKPLEQVMTPKVRVMTMATSDTVEHALEMDIESEYSRFPVLDTDGHMVGVVGTRTLARACKHKPGIRVAEVMTKPVLMHAAVKTHMAFHRLQKMGRNLAGVVDMQGRLVGVVTLEDLLEELVGEIE